MLRLISRHLYVYSVAPYPSLCVFTEKSDVKRRGIPRSSSEVVSFNLLGRILWFPHLAAPLRLALSQIVVLFPGEIPFAGYLHHHSRLLVESKYLESR
jgi:hypothetical protein